MSIRPFTFEARMHVEFGAGKVDAIAKFRPLKGAKKIGIITDRGVRGAGLTEKIEAALGDRVAFIDDGVVPDADTAHIDTVAARVKTDGVDALIAVGGGSVIDTAKATAASVGKGAPIATLAGMATIRMPLMAVVAVPTTAGTGAEATQFVVVKDHAAGQKVILMDQSLVPVGAILDPALTVGLPVAITAATAVDALTHAVEALGSRMANPIGDAFALDAIRLLLDDGALQRVLNDGTDIDARGQVLLAAHFAGQAISTSMLGACHAFAHALGAKLGTPHGVANGLFLIPTMRLNFEKSMAQYARIGRVLGGSGDDRALAEHAISRIEDAVHNVAKIPTRLADVGVTADDHAALADLVMLDPDLATNPVHIADAARALAIIVARA